MNKRLVILAMVLASVGVGAQTSYVPKSLTLYEGGYELYSELEYFQATQRVNEDGQGVEYNDGESFNMTDIMLGGSYGFTNRFQVNAGLKLRYNSSVVQYGSDQVSLSSFGMHSGLVGFRYSFPNQGGLLISLEGIYEPRFFTNKEYDGSEEPTELVLGDDGASTSVGAGATYMTKSKNYLSGRFFYRNPGDDLSAELYSEVEGVLAWDNLALLAGIEFVSSLNNDAYTNDSSNKPQVSSGSSFMFNSVNRNWTAPYLGLNIALNKDWRIESKAATRMAGTSTDLGPVFTIGLVKRISKSNEFKKKDSAFKEYTIEASVIKVSKTGKVVIIDAGASDGLKKKSRVDFFNFDYLGGNKLLAVGYVVKVGGSKAIVKIVKRYSKKRVTEGSVARSGLIREKE